MTLKVYITATTVEPRTNKDTSFRARTPRVLEYGNIYDVEDDVAKKLVDSQRANLVGEDGVPKTQKEADKQIERANELPSPEDTAPVKTAGGQAAKASDEDEDTEEIEVPTESSSVAEINAFAEDQDIDLTGASTKAEKIAKINEALGEDESDDEDEDTEGK